jgi:hypothetical protein
MKRMQVSLLFLLTSAGAADPALAAAQPPQPQSEQYK